MEYTDEELAKIAGVKIKSGSISNDELARIAGVKIKPTPSRVNIATHLDTLPQETVMGEPPINRMGKDMLSGIKSFSDLAAPPPSIEDVRKQVRGEKLYQNTLAEKSWRARLLPTPENVAAAEAYGLKKNPIGEFPNTATFERTHYPNVAQKAADVSGVILKSAAQARTLGAVPMPGNKYESSPVSGLSNLAGFMVGFPAGLLNAPVKSWITQVTPKLQKEWFGRVLSSALSDIPAGAAYGVGNQIGSVSQEGKWNWADASKEAAIWGLMGAVVGGGKETWNAIKEVRAANKLHDLLNGKITVEQSKDVIRKMRERVDAEPAPQPTTETPTETPTKPVRPQVEPTPIEKPPVSPAKQPTVNTYYRGTNPGATERIKTGDAEWDSYLFVTDNTKSAKMYGDNIETVNLKPDAKILREGTSDFVRVAGRWRKGESMLDYSSRAAKAAKDAGYDAIHFKRQTDVGTAILNRNAIEPPVSPKGEAKQPIEPPKPPTEQPVEPPRPLEPQRITSSGGDVTVGDIRPRAQTGTTPEGGREVTGLNVDEINRLRQHLNLDGLQEHEKQSFEQALSSAKSQGLDGRAVDNATEILQRPRTMSPEEHAGMVLEATKLKSEYNGLTKDIAERIDAGDAGGAEIAQARRDAVELQLNIITEAADKAGTIAGRNLSIRRMLLNNDTYDLASIVQRATIKKGAPLTREEVGKYEELSKKYDEVRAKLDAMESTEAERIAAEEVKRAERVIKIQEKRAAMTVKNVAKRNKILEERESIKKALRDIGYRVNDITGVTTEGAYHIGRLAISYIKEGVNSLDEIVQRIKSDIPDLAHLTMRDIAEAINTKNPNAQARARTAIEKRIANIKTQSKLIVEIDNAENGIFNPKRTKAVQPLEIQQLQKTIRKLRSEAFRSDADPNKLTEMIRKINDVQDQLSGQWRHVGGIKRFRPPTTPELETLRAQLKNLRETMSNKDELANLEEQLRTGNIVAKVDPPKREITPELLKSRIELQKAKRAIQREIELRKPTTPRKAAFEVANTLRSLKATADMSSTLRQALPTLLANPARSAKNFGKSVGAFFSNNKADQIDYMIHEMPEQFYRDKAKLELSEWSSPSVTKREEMFMDQWVERVPYFGQIFKSSNRHMVSFLNLQRVGMFDDFLHKYSNATDEELSAWAHYINVMTGRGDLVAQGKAAEVLGQLFFAPRFAASRVQAPFMIANRLAHYRDLPRVSKEVAKNAASLLSTGIAALLMAKMAGLDVTMDPDDADFGKIRIGDTRVDIFAGFVQPARLLARIAEFPLDRAGITQSADKRDLQDMVYRFASMKLSPGVASAYWGLTGKDLIGREVGIDEAAINAFVPMVVSDFIDAWKTQGPLGATASGAGSFMGLGVSTYSDSRTAVIHKMRRLIDQGSVDEAYRIADEWNMKNPDKQEIGDVKSTTETLQDREEAKQQ